MVTHSGTDQLKTRLVGPSRVVLAKATGHALGQPKEPRQSTSGFPWQSEYKVLKKCVPPHHNTPCLVIASHEYYAKNTLSSEIPARQIQPNTTRCCCHLKQNHFLAAPLGHTSLLLLSNRNWHCLFIGPEKKSFHQGTPALKLLISQKRWDLHPASLQTVPTWGQNHTTHFNDRISV